jgi:PAS domain S-box-containing protein
VSIHGKMLFNARNEPERFIGTMVDITDEKVSAQLLRDNEERFRMAVKLTRLGTWEYKPQLGQIKFSGECRRIYGIEENDAIDYSFLTTVVHPDDKLIAESALRDAINNHNEGSYSVEHRINRLHDKQVRWIRTHGKVYHNEGGNPERIIGTVLDITEAKRKEQELIESVELFQTMADNVPAMIWMSGTDKFNDYFNRTWLDFTGRTLADEASEGWLEGVHPEDRQKCLETYNASLLKREGFYAEYRLKRFDGAYRWIADNSVPRFSTGGEFLGFISACIDIDDQKRFREKILDSEILFKTITNAAPTALWMTDNEKKTVFINETWLKWTHTSFDAQLDSGWLNSIFEEERNSVVTQFNDAFNERKYFAAEFRLPTAQVGKFRWCITEGKPYYDINGKFAGYAGSVTDISEIREMEHRKDEFIKMASHELKTPITSISGYVQLLLNICESAEEEKFNFSKPVLKSSLWTISRQVSRLTRLISELLDLSRIESGRLELNRIEFNLEDLVEESVQEARHTTDQHAILFNTEFKGSITGDRDRLGQVLTNLLNNAIKYSRSADKVEVFLFREDDQVIIEVKDYGIGIHKKDQARIFERFYRAEGKSEQTYPGFGIGLFIANEIVQRHGGSLKVDSKKNSGATFTIQLPCQSNSKPGINGKRRTKNTGGG